MSRWGHGKSARFHRVAAVLCSALLAVTLTGAPATAKSLAVGARSDHAQLQSLMDELVDDGIPGVLTTVDDGPGPAWRGASGAARLDPRVPLRP